MTPSDQMAGSAPAAASPAGGRPPAATEMQIDCRCGCVALTIAVMDLPALARRRGPGSLFRRGPHDAEILRLAIPALGALVAEPLFLLGDSAIVGRIGTVPLGGLGVASQALTTLVNMSIFLAYGTTAAVARQLGAGNRRAAIQQGIDGLWLAGGIGVAVLA